MVATTHRHITDYRSSAAETCRANGLSRGAVLRGDEGFGADTIRIDYIGTDIVIAVVIESARASQQLGVERSWTISEHRNWEVISSGAPEEPSDEALTNARNRAESWLLWAESSANEGLRGDASAFRLLLGKPITLPLTAEQLAKAICRPGDTAKWPLRDIADYCGTCWTVAETALAPTQSGVSRG